MTARPFVLGTCTYCSTMETQQILHATDGGGACLPAAICSITAGDAASISVKHAYITVYVHTVQSVLLCIQTSYFKYF